jgi:16S rRNA (guanine1207-N2)-methyltransferase
MSDQAFQLLVEPLNTIQGNILWIVDENISSQEAQTIQRRNNLSVLSNRYDISTHLKQQGFHVVLSDFERCSFPEKSFDAVIYRVSKEKAVVHHIVNNAGHWLKQDGQFYLAGFKNDGIKTYAKKAEDYLGELINKKRGEKTAMLFSLAASNVTEDILDDKDYTQTRMMDFPGTPGFYSKPGVFGWNKADKGSEFLVEYLPHFLQGFSARPKTVLDLGCGYGYLSVMASQLISARFTATDNNITAVTVCRKNFAEHALQGEVVLDSCAENIHDRFELVLCNPPFHQGFDVEGELTDRFLKSCHRLLAPKGKALFVVNAFIPLERKAADLFETVETVANNRSFKLVALSLVS